MLRPSTSVCGLTETALQTTEQDEKSLELFVVGFFLKDETEQELGVKEDGMESDWVPRSDDAKELIKEAEAIFAYLLWFCCSGQLSLSVCLLKKESIRRYKDLFGYWLPQFF